MTRRLLMKAAVVAALIFHAVKVRQGKSLPLTILSFLGNLSTKSGLLGTLVGDAVGLIILCAAWRIVRRLLADSFKNHYNNLADYGYDSVRRLPIIRSMVLKEMHKHEADIKSGMIPKDQKYTPHIPEEGMPKEEIIALMESFVQKEKGKWEEGKVSGAVYHGGSDHVDVMNAASSLYAITNPLHLDLWPSLQKFESDICKMTANICRGTCRTVCGSMTSGGTESIVLAVRAHKEYAASQGITHPEIIACVTAHAAINKACEMFGIHLIQVPADPVTFKMDVAATKKAISSDTIMIYSSAPNFPSGMIDDIPALSKLAVKYKVGLHVDCCLGGFILPFAKEAGFDIPDFDFSCPGVTTMSVDTHKYGYAAKGSSVVLYRTKELRRFQYFTYPKWTGGLYATATIAGSRPGMIIILMRTIFFFFFFIFFPFFLSLSSLFSYFPPFKGSIVASTWASMVHVGRNGYVENAKAILQTAQEIAKGVATIPELYVLGKPQGLEISIFFLFFLFFSFLFFFFFSLLLSSSISLRN